VTLDPGSSQRVAILGANPPRGRLRLGPAEAAVFETFVVPRYLTIFGELLLENLVESEGAQVVHLHCLTGYPDRGIALRLPGSYIVGVDTSAAALELARAKAATMPDMSSEYRLVDSLPAVDLPDASFSHGLVMHPLASGNDRRMLLEELKRLLAGHGQALIAMPMRGSFQEIIDLLREYSLKHDDAEVGRAVESAAQVRPTVETLGGELEDLGFDFVDVSLRPTTLRFQSGRDFFEDPVARLIILPEIRLDLKLEDAEAALAYVRLAIDKYWSDSPFELSINVGCATGRKVG
jgi:SAM-dependent methyltransferase